jgi:hypothetical protein
LLLENTVFYLAIDETTFSIPGAAATEAWNNIIASVYKYGNFVQFGEIQCNVDSVRNVISTKVLLLTTCTTAKYKSDYQDVRATYLFKLICKLM